MIEWPEGPQCCPLNQTKTTVWALQLTQLCPLHHIDFELLKMFVYEWINP